MRHTTSRWDGKSHGICLYVDTRRRLERNRRGGSGESGLQQRRVADGQSRIAEAELHVQQQRQHGTSSHSVGANE